MTLKLIQIIANGALTLSGVLHADKFVNLNLSIPITIGTDLTALIKENKNLIKIIHE
jgi:hypothetical protein